MFKLDNDFLTSLGLGGLPVEEKNKLLQMIYERLEMNVGMRLAEKMTDQQLDEFEGFIDRNDEAGALKWLESNFPNYKDVVAEELEKLRVEVTNAAPQILASQQGVGQTPPIMNEPQMPGVPQPQPAMPSQQPYGPQPAYNVPAPQPGFGQPVPAQQPQPAYSAQPFGPPQQPGFTSPAPQPAFNPNPAPAQPAYTPPAPSSQPAPSYQPPTPMQQPSFGAPASQPQPAPGFQPQTPVQPQQFTPPPQGFTPGQ